MLIKTEKDIVNLVREDEWMMAILYAAKSLNLPDWWVCAGFVRAKVWDALQVFSKRTHLPDVDVIYFDRSNLREDTEKELESKLLSRMPEVPWSVKNEARMHLVNDLPPYSSSVDAISKFPETATALGLKLNEHNEVILTAPCGIEDLLALKIKPTPYFAENEKLAEIYRQRIEKKSWKSIWPGVESIQSNV
ncbi:nucleotidyltransferase family protein [Bacillus sp. ISL-47]|uniref:nucleotidyltransferase family protein n=1 Tax=Bacillus sp. ISL-47 TaxID=2819130 RepID=UPI001BE9AB19|nr:nucleotidyltransferase family protein [Bacillus sp. ISL-47]MBT2687658.1 nucleotidyltransferase family protein [Bacillus sp. ISL-47]MBT2710690.1 nucleotidyltransferase family protein [Pseudomonas sp. ISL-84]